MTDAGRERCPECQVVGGHHPECPEDQVRMPSVRTTTWETHPIIDVCPCGSAQVARLMPDWQAQVDGGQASIPIVGCGAPWHYANLDKPNDEPFRQGVTLGLGQLR